MNDRDGFWNGVAQWFGISRSVDLNELIPNRNTFPADLLRGVDLFDRVDNPTLPPISTPPPSQSPTSQPTNLPTLPPISTPPPSQSPTSQPTVPPPTPEAPCKEDPDTMGYFGKDIDGVVMIKSCSWLERRRDKKRLCDVETHYYTIDQSETTFPPPQVACPITCENYCDPCFENGRTRFHLKNKYDGSPVFRTCNHLSRQFQNIINTICSRTESYEGYPIPSSACPITCGISDCVFQDANDLFESLVDLNVDMLRQGRDGGNFFPV